jgi:peptidylprolyl isomerase
MLILPKGKFKWFLIAIAAYIYYQDYMQRRNDEKLALIASQKNQEQIEPASGGNSVPKNTEPQVNFQERVINKIKENDTAKVVLDALVKKSIEDKYGKKEIREILALSTGSLAIVDVLKGDGAELRCGAQAVINYEAFMSGGIVFDTTKQKSGYSPLTVATGKNQVIRGLEAGIIGMKEGGKRKISIPPGLGFNVPGFENNMISKEDAISYEVELVAVKDGAYKNDLTVNVQSQTEGSGKRILCGDKVKIKYSLQDQQGSTLPGGSEEIEFILGSANVPMGLEFAVADMRIGGRKTVIIPHDLLKTVQKNILKSWIKPGDISSVQAVIEVIE